MGKKGSWFAAVKKVLSPDSKEKRDQLKSGKSKKWLAKEKEPDCPLPSSVDQLVSAAQPPVPQQVGETKSTEAIDNYVHKNPCSDAIETVTNVETAVVPAVETAPESAFIRNMSRYPGKSKEEVAAIRIQTVFRGFLARRALRALRGLERLKSLIEGQSVKRQAATTLKCMQNLAHLQSQIRARRVRMSEENQALHRQLQQKHEKELERLRLGKDWNVSMQSKEQIEANLQNKQDAAMRRERALAYSFTHQTKKNSRSVNPTFMDPNNPHWGWSWLERWMASRPWETRSTNITDKDFNDHASSKSTISRSISVTTDKKGKPSPTSTGQRAAQGRSTKTGGLKNTPDDDSKSAMSVQSRSQRRHSISGALAGDDESLASSSPVPSYMTPTKSTKARSKPASPLGVMDNGGASEKGPVKKRLSYPAAPQSGPRRHSVPAKIGSNSVENAVK